MKVAILKYNAGNIQSVKYALERLGINPIITDDHQEIRAADKVIFPGVGEAKSAMEHLQKTGLDQVLKSLKQPVLGICIGLQLMCEHSEEGDTDCLGIFPIRVRKFPTGVSLKGETLKIPHMGWNNVSISDSVLFKGFEEPPYVYYVHSFYADLSDQYTTATSQYATKYSGAIQKDNFYAVQFHPEKSGKVGHQILKNFLEL